MARQASESDASIVRSVVGLGHSLGLAVVAEGVEDETTWTALRDLGCTLAQGHFMSRPLPGDELAAWVAEYSAADAA